MSGRTTGRWRLVGVVLVGCFVLGLVGAGGALASITKTFSSTGKEQEFKVPAGVTSVEVVAIGAGGGEPSAVSPSGRGAVVSGTLVVTPGETLYVEVGGAGGESNGGFNGGGNGGESSGDAGGGGGGASDVRTESSSAASTLASRLIVAAGGGGSGHEEECGNAPGGRGGNWEQAGEAGHFGPARVPCEGGSVATGGEAGTQKEGGAGGTSGGGSGSLGQGGHGGGDTGGGGGGGLYGGGGGGARNQQAAAGGGGGGSNHIPEGGTLVGTAQAGQESSVTITYTVAPTTLTTTLSGEGKKGEKITVKQGEAVTDQATLSGENAATATGTATYNVYGDSGCTKLLGTVSSAVSGGKSETSPLTFVEAGTYYWRVSYSGDENNQGSEDPCGAEVLTVTAKPSTSTCGKTTVGKSSDQLLANVKRVNQCTLPVNATLSEMSIYLSPTSHAGSQLIKGVVYGDATGSPTGLLGTTIRLTFTSKSKAGWYHLAFATPLKLAAGNYWIGMITGASQYVAAEHYDSVANAEDYNSNSYTAGASKSFGSFKTTNEQMSLYATFTPEVQRCAAIRPNTIC
jgi:hypothetical protein